MATDIRGYAAIITGAGSGIGAAIAVKLAAAGCSVFLIGRTLSKLEETQKAIFSVNVDAKVKVSSLDVTDKDLLEDAVRDCVEHFGSLDIVVNNAGRGVLTTSSIEEWDAAVDVNVKAAMRLTKFSLPHLAASAGAGKVPTILNIASVSGKNAYASLAPYCATKHALVGFSNSIFAAVKTKGIHVTVMCPGWVDTPMISPLSVDLDKCLTAEQVADTAHYLVTLPKNVCIPELTIVAPAD